MPDGFHAKPMRLWALKKQKKRLEPSSTPEQMGIEREDLRKAYFDLPEPRPDYFQWLVLMTDEERFWRLEELSRNAPLPGDRIKASSMLQEYGKAKPKQQIELSNAKAEDTEIAAVLRKIVAIKGLQEVQRMISGNVEIH